MIALPFREVWAIDFEFRVPPGEVPEVVCMAGRELWSGRRLRLWADELPRQVPFPTDDGTLVVSYFASAEMGAFLALGWEMPRMVLDLFCEFRAFTNGLPKPSGNNLVGALVYFGLSHLAADEKESMQQRVLKGPPWAGGEREAILDYCESDVDALAALLSRMLPEIASSPRRLGQALLRGRYMRAVASMEHNGVPLDVELLDVLRNHWNAIKLSLIDEVDRRYGVFDNGSFRQARFEMLVSRMGIAWPRTATGLLSTDNDTFKDQARLHPELMELKELMSTLGQIRLFDIPVGSDGRNRCLLSPFRAVTGRNQPSSKKFIFGPAVWMRSLIKPAPGRALGYLDWASQEIAIAASLSGDEDLLRVVREGDPYLGFARLAGLAPPEATKETHEAVREFCKVLFLAVGYGMGEHTLAAHLGRGVSEARNLLELYREAFPRRTTWAQGVCDIGTLGGRLETVFGWPLHVGADTKPTTLRNWPVQSHGNEILRLACCLATESGIKVCAPVHDALLVEADNDRIDSAIQMTRACMDEASRIVLGGLVVKVDQKVVRYPDRYHDKRGRPLFEKVQRLPSACQEGFRHVLAPFRSYYEFTA